MRVIGPPDSRLNYGTLRQGPPDLWTVWKEEGVHGVVFSLALYFILNLIPLFLPCLVASMAALGLSSFRFYVEKKLGRIDLERISLFSDTSQHLWVQLQRRYGKIEAPHGQIFTSTSVVLLFLFFPCCMYPDAQNAAGVVCIGRIFSARRATGPPRPGMLDGI